MIKGITFVHAASTPAVYDTLQRFFFSGRSGAGPKLGDGMQAAERRSSRRWAVSNCWMA